MRQRALGAKAALFSALGVTYLVVACATGSVDDTPEGGGLPPGNQDGAVDDAAPTGDEGSPETFDSSPGHDHFVPPPDDNFVPPDDSSLVDTFVPPLDAPFPSDTGFSDATVVDVGSPVPTCPLLGFKYAFEAALLGESAVPCSLGCNSKQCCWHGESPPVCLHK